MTRLAALVVLVGGLVGAEACGGTVDVPVLDEADPTGIWQYSEADSEVTVELATDGSFERVNASLAAMQCGRDSGSWAVAGDELVLSLDATSGGGQERFTLSVDDAVLSLTDAAGGTRLYSSVPQGVSCVDYGFGSWEGTLSASVDGEAFTFDDVEVDLDIDGGSLRVTSLWRPCPTCPPEAPELVVEIDAPGELEPGTYTVQNFAGAEMTMFGFFHPDPGNPDFEGFSTERLSPPGEFVLTAVAPESISASFSFRGNPRSDGDMAPDGSTFTLVTEGVAELTYR